MYVYVKFIFNNQKYYSIISALSECKFLVSFLFEIIMTHEVTLPFNLTPGIFWLLSISCWQIIAGLLIIINLKEIVENLRVVSCQ